MQRYVVTQAPSGSLVSADEVKALARIDGTDEDALIASFVAAAVERLGAYTNRCFLTRTLRMETDRISSSGLEPWPFVEIERAPLGSVSAVEVVTTSGNQAVTGFKVKDGGAFPRILFPASAAIPSEDPDEPLPLRITFTAGYGDASAVPADIKLAVMMLANFLYANRGDCMPECAGTEGAAAGIPPEVRALVSRYRIINRLTAF